MKKRSLKPIMSTTKNTRQENTLLVMQTFPGCMNKRQCASSGKRLRCIDFAGRRQPDALYLQQTQPI